MIWTDDVYLMVDLDALATERRNLSIVREQAYKHHANPLMTGPALRLGGEPAGICPMLVVRDGGIFRGWYQLRPVGRPELEQAFRDSPYRIACTMCKDYHVGYAESDDGLHWDPVEVGRVEHQGSRRNNLVDFGVPPDRLYRVSWLMADPLDRDYPFKSAYYRPAHGAELDPGILAQWPWARERDYWLIWGIGRSRDGLVWEPPQGDGYMIRENPETARLHRARGGDLVIADQMTSPYAEHPSRNVRAWVSRDGVSADLLPEPLFAIPDHMTRLYAHHNYRQGVDGARWVQPHVGLVVMRKGPTFLALNGYLYSPAAGMETFAQAADVGLCVSADGLMFREVWPMRPFIACGPRDAFDDGMVAQCCITETADQTWFYYAGGRGNLGGEHHPGLAWIPRDRFGYCLLQGFRDTQARPRCGQFTLGPLRLPDRPALTLNADHLDDDRTIRVEVQDEHGQALPGLALDDCAPVTQPGLATPVIWKAGRSPAEHAGAKVRLQVVLSARRCGLVRDDSPRLYAIQTATPPPMPP